MIFQSQIICINHQRYLKKSPLEFLMGKSSSTGTALQYVPALQDLIIVIIPLLQLPNSDRLNQSLMVKSLQSVQSVPEPAEGNCTDKLDSAP